MKATRLLYTTVWLLLAAKFGQCIYCYYCDPFGTDASNSSSSCETHSKVKDCSKDPEFGQYYDSCFTQVIYAHGKATVYIKECAILDGCQDLQDILCQDSVDESGNPSPENCWVDCCQEDFCNTNPADNPGYVKRRRAMRTKLSSSVHSRSNFVLKSMTFISVVTSSFIALVYTLIPW